MFFERTAISKKLRKTIYNEIKKLKDEKEMSVNLLLKDPYIVDFLVQKDTYNEAGSKI